MNKRTMNESRYQSQLENPQIKIEEWRYRSVQKTITNSRLVLRKKDLVNLWNMKFEEAYSLDDLDDESGLQKIKNEV